MKKLVLTTLFFGVSSGAIAQAYVTIPYYGNNPFLFCTIGVPQDCWAPISKELGTFTVTNPYCFNEASAKLFATICPKAFPLGAASSMSRMMSPASTHDPADASP